MGKFNEKLMRKLNILLETESAEEFIEKVVLKIAEMDQKYNVNNEQFTTKLMKYVMERKIVLGTPILYNILSEKNGASACTVIPVEIKRDFEKMRDGIYNYAMLGIGMGFDLDEIDEPIYTLKVLNEVLKSFDNDARRPTAGMATISAENINILEFIKMKENANYASWRFNLSVKMSDEFIEKIKHSVDVEVIVDGKNQTMKANELLRKMSDSMHFCGEPGIIFIDSFERDNPTPIFKYEGFAPCAEIGMSKGEVCHFSYINLAEFVNEGVVDMKEIIDCCRTGTRMLDNIVDHSIEKKVENTTNIIEAKRRVGLGICGTADMFYKLRMPYGNEESKILLENILASINYYSKVESVSMARERGKFQLFEESRYKDYEWFMRFADEDNQIVLKENWNELWNLVKEFGIRNSATVALPPTGKSASIAMTSYSIEPRFSLLEPDGSINSQFLFEISKLNLSEIQKLSLIQEVLKTGRCGDIETLPEEIKDIFVTALEVSPSKQIGIVSSATKYVDESVSKTLNIPNYIGKEEVNSILLDIIGSNIKGITLFRDGCLEGRETSMDLEV
ncbi:MAG TPA: hypothetical protein DCP90_00030 [Clostridiales bacterium]|nr:MAG: hypothetical protein A2Y22_02655 [Clostridiales bacterium GWD2_32_59]HAN08982.1 hypothetical protein [Clostridiales bacterium]